MWNEQRKGKSLFMNKLFPDAAKPAHGKYEPGLKRVFFCQIRFVIEKRGGLCIRCQSDPLVFSDIRKGKGRIRP